MHEIKDEPAFTIPVRAWIRGVHQTKCDFYFRLRSSKSSRADQFGLKSQPRMNENVVLIVRTPSKEIDARE